MKSQRELASGTEHSEVKDAGMELYGRWLLGARVVWIGVTLLVVVLNGVMLPRYYGALLATCVPGPQCFALQVSAADRQMLQQWGLPVGFVAGYQVMLDAVSVLVCCALGALIFWRKSADRMALFCAFMLVLFGGAGFTSILQNTLAFISSVGFALVGILDVLGQSSFMVFFLLFPSGRFVPRWTRWLALCIFLYWIPSILLPNSFSTENSLWSDLLFVAFLLCVVGTQIYRYRRVSTVRERQQTKWVVFGVSIGIGGFLLVLFFANVLLVPFLPSVVQSGVLETIVVGTVIYGFLLLIPVSMAIAILRSRLYDIDVVINKVLVYGSLTALLTVIYAGLIIGLESLVGVIAGRGSTNTFALVASTLGIAALFQPLRRRIQEAIDRRFYRRRYDAARTVAAFSTTLRSEVDLSQLSEHLVAVVQETMQPAHVSLWLRPSKQYNPLREYEVDEQIPQGEV